MNYQPLYNFNLLQTRPELCADSRSFAPSKSQSVVYKYKLQNKTKELKTF